MQYSKYMYVNEPTTTTSISWLLSNWNGLIRPTKAGNGVRSKLKVQNSSTFQGLFKDPNCIFQAPKLSTKSHILEADIQNLDCNVTLKCTVLYSPIPWWQKLIKYCFQVLVTCIQVLASKLSTNAKFQNLQDVNSRTFQGFSSTFKHLICFQALSRALKFLFQIQAFSRTSQAGYEPWGNTWRCIPNICLTIFTSSKHKWSTRCQSTAYVFAKVQSTDILAYDRLSVTHQHQNKCHSTLQNELSSMKDGGQTDWLHYHPC